MVINKGVTMSSKSKQETQKQETQKKEKTFKCHVCGHHEEEGYGGVYIDIRSGEPDHRKRICEGCEQDQNDYINETLHDDDYDIW